MDIEDIKSPLPPRRFRSVVEEVPVENKETVVTPPESSNEVVSTPAPTTTNNDNKKKLLTYGGMGILGVIIILLVVGVILPFVRNNGQQKETVITYWGLWEEPAIMQGVIADYESQNPGTKINYVRNQKTNYRTRLQTRLESDSSGEAAPDIFRIHASWLPMMKNNMAKVPADTATTIGLDTDFFESYKNDIKEGSNWYGVPLMYDGLALFYNKDLLNSGQVELPKSWWDLETAANKLTVRDETGKIKVAGAALGLVDNVDHWSDIVGLMMKQGGVDILATDAQSEKKLKDVLTFYTLFRSKDHVWDETLPSSTELFANGKLAFYFAPSWRIFNIEETKTTDLNYGITTVPQLQTLQNVPADQANNAANLTNIHWSSYWIEGVNANSKNQTEAWKFLEYLSTKENLEKLYAAASQTRNFGEIYPRKSMADKISENNNIKPFVAAANDASGWYLSSRTFDEGLNDGMNKYFGDAINSVVLKNMKIDDVMPDLRNGINQMIQKYQIK